MKEIQIEGEHGDATKTYEKKLQGSQIYKKQKEAAFHGHIVEPDNKFIEKDSDMEKLEAILHVHIKDHEKQLQLKDAEMEQLETALQEKGFKRVHCYQDPRLVEEVK